MAAALPSSAVCLRRCCQERVLELPGVELLGLQLPEGREGKCEG